MCTDRLLCICVFRVKCLKTRQRLRQSDLSQNLLDLQPGSTYRSNVHIAVKRSHSLNLCTILHHPNFILVHFNDFIIYLYLYLYIIYLYIYIISYIWRTFPAWAVPKPRALWMNSWAGELGSLGSHWNPGK